MAFEDFLEIVSLRNASIRAQTIGVVVAGRIITISVVVAVKPSLITSAVVEAKHVLGAVLVVVV